MLNKKIRKERVSVFYEAELRFLQSVFGKCRLQTLLLDPAAPLDKRVDMGLNTLLGTEEGYSRSLLDLHGDIEPNTIYKIKNSFLCRYLFLLLPETDSRTVLLAGPYLDSALSSQQILELAENAGIPPQQVPSLEKYFSFIPVLSENSRLFSVMDAFGERIWGSDCYTVTDMNSDFSAFASPLAAKQEQPSAEKVAWNMRMLEARYEYENELMHAVSHGLTHKVEMILSSFSSTGIERRLSDPVRELKNYSIIINTLLRKSAENGGVHPIYLDSVSSGFAHKIEQLSSAVDVQQLMGDMLRAYCRLVKKHATKQYSPPVQKTITYIDSDLTADLSLSALAAAQNISASYLSALFRQETGQTLTEHVNRKRVEHARHLLETTGLQVQTVAQHCGILDVHYFSKLFKKYTGKTPKEYRNA